MVKWQYYFTSWILPFFHFAILHLDKYRVINHGYEPQGPEYSGDPNSEAE
jgi:hypothetical protein